MTASPLPNRSNRDDRGRFVKGCKAGPGNPRGKTVAKMQGMIRDCVSDADLRAIIEVIVKQAMDGSLPACREVLDRLVGKPAQAAEANLPVEVKTPCSLFVTFPEDRRGPAEVAAAQPQQPSSTSSAATADEG